MRRYKSKEVNPDVMLMAVTGLDLVYLFDIRKRRGFQCFAEFHVIQLPHGLLGMRKRTFPSSRRRKEQRKEKKIEGSKCLLALTQSHFPFQHQLDELKYFCSLSSYALIIP